MNREETILFYIPYVECLSNTICYLKNITNHAIRQDCCSAGLEALILAVDNYSPRYGATIQTYIANKVNWAIYDSLRLWFGDSRFGKQILEVKSPSCCLDDVTNSLECSSDGIEESIIKSEFIEKIMKFSESIGRKKGKSEILWKYFGDEYTMKEIAEQINCTESNVSLIISRLKSDINNRFKKEYKGEICL